MYRYSNGQISLADFKQPVGMNLKESNRWVKKAQTIPWLEIEKRYAALFTNRKGNVAKPLRLALGDKRGIRRFGFLLPMDEALARCALDISGRPYLTFKAKFKHRHVGDLSTEMIEHFFRSLSQTMGITLNLKAKGGNGHHVAESLFKAFGRTLRDAVRVEGTELPSSKGVL